MNHIVTITDPQIMLLLGLTKTLMHVLWPTVDIMLEKIKIFGVNCTNVASFSPSLCKFHFTP